MSVLNKILNSLCMLCPESLIDDGDDDNDDDGGGDGGDDDDVDDDDDHDDDVDDDDDTDFQQECENRRWWTGCKNHLTEEASREYDMQALGKSTFGLIFHFYIFFETSLTVITTSTTSTSWNHFHFVPRNKHSVFELF